MSDFELDLDQILQTSPDGSEHWIEITDKTLFPDASPRLKFRIALKEQKRILDRFIRSTVALPKGGETPQEMTMNIDFLAIGSALLPYITDWQGFKGAFDRAKVKLFFEKFPSVCEAVGKNFNEFLKTIEAHYLQGQEASKKT